MLKAIRHKPTYCNVCGTRRDPYSNSCLGPRCLAEYWEREAQHHERKARDCRETAARLRKESMQ